MKHIQALAIQVAFAALVVAGWIYGIDGARNVVHFATWLVLLPLGVVAAFSDKLHADMAKKPPPPAVIRAIARIGNWSILGVLLWQGSIATGFAFALFMLGGAIASALINKRRDAAAQEQQTADKTTT